MTRLVIGVGNRFRGDDGAGPAAVAELRRLAPAGLETITVEGHAAELLEAWVGADDVVAIDAARSRPAPADPASTGPALSGPAPPGTVHRFDAVSAPLPAGLESGSTHGLGLPEAVELARALGKLPRRLTVYAIEGRDFTPGAALSEGVRRAVREVAAELAADGDSAAAGTQGPACASARSIRRS